MKNNVNFYSLLGLLTLSFILLFSCTENTQEEITPNTEDIELRQAIHEILAPGEYKPSKGHTKATACYEVSFTLYDCETGIKSWGQSYYYSHARPCNEQLENLRIFFEAMGACYSLEGDCRQITCPSEG